MKREKEGFSLKRAFDLAVAGVGIVLSAPSVAFAAAAMAVVNRSNPFIVQDRVGKDGKLFRIFKIKTMRDARDGEGRLLPETERTTRLGEFFRKTRIDELPQLLNVLRGDMSIVGPRPWLAGTDPLITQDKKRHTIKPGVTGVSQVMGNNKLTLEMVLDYDHAYVDRQALHGSMNNLIFDATLVAATPWSILRNRKAPHYRPT